MIIKVTTFLFEIHSIHKSTAIKCVDYILYTNTSKPTTERYINQQQVAGAVLQNGLT